MPRFMMALLLLASMVSFQETRADLTEEAPEPVTFTPANQRYPMLTPLEFRGLTPEMQREYILTLREFVTDMSAITPNEMPVTANGKWELLKQALGLDSMPEAQAAELSPGQCRIAPSTSGGLSVVSLYCPGQNGVSDTIQIQATSVSRYDTPEEIAAALTKELNGRPVKLQMSESELASQVAAWQNEDSGAKDFSAPLKYPENRAVRIVSTPASSTPVVVELPPDADLNVSKAGPLETKVKFRGADPVETQTNVADSKGTAISLDNQKPVADVEDIKGKPRTPSRAEAEAESMNQLKKLEDDHKGPLRCIYAGFAIKRKSADDKTGCVPVDSFMSQKGKEVYACEDSKVSAEHKKAASKIVLPKTAPKGKVVLCNPLVFGLDKDGSPFCVPRNKKATESCKFVSSKSSQKKASIDSAVKMALDNPMVLSEIRWTYEKLCKGNDADIQSALGNMPAADLAKSKQDLAQTCASYQEKLASFPRGGRLPAASGSSTGNK